MVEMNTPWRVEADERNYEVRGNLTSDTYIAGYNIYTADGDEVVGCEGIIDLTSYRADFIVHCVNSHASLVEENKRLRAKIGAIEAFIGNVDHSRGGGANAARMYGEMLNDIRDIAGDANA